MTKEQLAKGFLNFWKMHDFKEISFESILHFFYFVKKEKQLDLDVEEQSEQVMQYLCNIGLAERIRYSSDMKKLFFKHLASEA